MGYGLTLTPDDMPDWVDVDYGHVQLPLTVSTDPLIVVYGAVSDDDE